MSSWEAPHNWRSGELAATVTASGTINMNNQVYSNMDWLGTTHDHSGGTHGASTLGLVTWIDLIDDGTGDAGISATAQRMWTTGGAGTSIWAANGTTSSFEVVNATHSHVGF